MLLYKIFLEDDRILKIQIFESGLVAAYLYKAKNDNQPFRFLSVNKLKNWDDFVPPIYIKSIIPISINDDGTLNLKITGFQLKEKDFMVEFLGMFNNYEVEYYSNNSKKINIDGKNGLWFKPQENYKDNGKFIEYNWTTKILQPTNFDQFEITYFRYLIVFKCTI